MRAFFGVSGVFARHAPPQSEQRLRIAGIVFVENLFEIDASAVHLLATLNNQPIACLRIIDYHKIGRMAVLKEFRKNGLGAALLLAAVAICKKHGSKSVVLSAQTHAIGFYSKAGFKVTSAEYCDVDIPHVDMQMTLD